MTPAQETCADARRSPRHCRATGLAFAAAALLACGGCQSTGALDEMVAMSPFPDGEALAAATTNAAQPVSLSQAVAYALASDPKLSALRAEVHREAGNAAEATTPRSPELRFGFGREDQDARGWTRETENGGGDRTGFETYQQMQYSGTSHATDFSGQTEDSLRLGVRYFPPNPWLMAAAGGAARARRWMAQAHLVEEEHAVICDTVEAAVQIAYGERVLRVRDAFAAACRALYEEVRRASDEGQLPRTDAIDARLRLASAEAGRAREADRLASWRQKFRMATGFDPGHLSLHAVEAGAICPVALTHGTPQMTALARTLARQRPDVLAAHWNRLRYQREWSEARAAGYPWLNHIEGAYTRWDIYETRQRTAEQSRDETEATWELGSLTDIEYESTTDFSKQHAYGGADADEWWIGVSVDLPIFEWFSKQSGERHRALDEATRGYEAGRARAEREIIMAGQVLRDSRADLAAFRQSCERDCREIEELAAMSAEMDLRGRLDALRLRERSAEMEILALERAAAVALDELQFCRASGLAPGQPLPPAGAKADLQPKTVDPGR